MARGPLPKPTAQRRRTNQPTIPTTALPAAGRPGQTPRPPRWIHLGEAGKAWWRWAWSTPQAAAWSPGDLVAIARRASLEDDLDAIGRIEGGIDMAEMLELEDADAVSLVVDAVVGRLQRLASGKLAIAKECRELDDRFGLTPKAMAALRWTIVADDKAKEEGKPEPAATVRRLKVVG